MPNHPMFFCRASPHIKAEPFSKAVSGVGPGARIFRGLYSKKAASKMLEKRVEMRVEAILEPILHDFFAFFVAV